VADPSDKNQQGDKSHDEKIVQPTGWSPGVAVGQSKSTANLPPMPSTSNVGVILGSIVVGAFILAVILANVL
jgi:hypothetical protein